MAALLIFLAALPVTVFAVDENQQQEQAAASEQQKPPFVGQVKSDSVNIRAGGNQNFEVLAKANSNDLISVIDESFGWYKVLLPKTAYCYVSKDFIEKNGSTGISKVSNLNLRARPDAQSSIIGQLAKGDSAIITEETKDGWYQIVSPANCYGWIYADFIRYYSGKNQALSFSPNSPVAHGTIEKVGFSFRKKPTSYKLVKNDKLVCYLKSDKYNLKDFEGKPVLVWGNNLKDEHGDPILNVFKIQSEE